VKDEGEGGKQLAEYLASQKTLREFKEGDRIQVTFTQARSC